MLDTEEFISKLAGEGYNHFCVVPFSFGKNLINASINHSKKIEYLPCASEAVACSVAIGLKKLEKNQYLLLLSVLMIWSQLGRL
jgi:hypothetical protein